MMERIQYSDFTDRLRHLCVRNSLAGMPRKYKDKLIIALCIARSLDAGREFSEVEINAAILEWLEGHTRPASEDYVTPRRLLVDLGFLKRTPDGSVYRINPDSWVWNQYDPRVMDLDIDGFLATAREAGPGQGWRTDN